jgi:hypothetical protein
MILKEGQDTEIFKMINDPFAIEPTRTNVLQLPQILKEVPTLETSIDNIKKSIDALEAKKTILKKEKVLAKKAVKPLPQRFEEPDRWNYQVKNQHLMYTTTTNQYGFYKPTKFEMPDVFNGKSAKFSEVLLI